MSTLKSVRMEPFAPDTRLVHYVEIQLSAVMYPLIPLPYPNYILISLLGAFFLYSEAC